MPQTALEPNSFAGQIASVLQDAGVEVKTLSSFGMMMTGLMILYPDTLEKVGNVEEEPLYRAFKDARLVAGAGSLKNWFPFMNIPRDIPIVFVGEKYLFRPPTDDATAALPR
jgi:hypothetical protein